MRDLIIKEKKLKKKKNTYLIQDKKDNRKEINDFCDATAYIKIESIDKRFEIDNFTYLEEISDINFIYIEIIDELLMINEKILNKNIEIILLLMDRTLKFSKEYREKKILGYIKNYSIERKRTELGYEKNFIKIKICPFIMKLDSAFKRKIFHNKNIPEIIEDVLRFRKFKNYKLSLKKNKSEYEKKEFLIQFDESDLNFIYRLLENNGFYYYISNESNEQYFIISDRTNIHKSILGNELELVEEITTETCYKEIICPKISQNKNEVEFYLIHDYNHELSKLNLTKKTSNLNIYETNYEFDYLSNIEGDSKILEFEKQSKYKSNIFSFKTRRVLDLFSKFKIKDKTKGVHWANGEYYAYRIFMKYFDNLCLFKIRSVKTELIFAKKPFYKKPKIIGSHLAQVVSKNDEKQEVFVDKYATVLIKFMWQQTDNNKKEPGIKVRVSQLLGGKSGNSGICGIWVIPRIGQEVIVTFINGDPDRPIITGVVLNSDNLSIFDKNGISNGLKKIAIKTATIPNAKDGHELIFDDEDKKQKITLLSSKDLDIIVNDNTRFQLKNNYDTNIKNGNYSISMEKGKMSITLEKGGINIKSADNIKIECDKELNIKANKIVIASNTSIEAKANTAFKFEAKIGEITLSSKLDISGSIVGIQSKGIFNIKATGPLNLNGAIISLN